MDPDRLVPILERVRGLLLKYKLSKTAAVTAELVELARLGSPDFVKRLQGGEVWGKGLADVAFEGNVEGPEEQLRRDDEEYMRLLASLAEEMEAQGIASQGSNFVAREFREGLESP